MALHRVWAKNLQFGSDQEGGGGCGKTDDARVVFGAVLAYLVVKSLQTLCQSHCTLHFTINVTPTGICLDSIDLPAYQGMNGCDGKVVWIDTEPDSNTRNPTLRMARVENAPKNLLPAPKEDPLQWTLDRRPVRPGQLCGGSECDEQGSVAPGLCLICGDAVTEWLGQLRNPHFVRCIGSSGDMGLQSNNVILKNSAYLQISRLIILHGSLRKSGFIWG